MWLISEPRPVTFSVRPIMRLLSLLHHLTSLCTLGDCKACRSHPDYLACSFEMLQLINKLQPGHTQARLDGKYTVKLAQHRTVQLAQHSTLLLAQHSRVPLSQHSTVQLAQQSVACSTKCNLLITVQYSLLSAVKLAMADIKEQTHNRL